MMSYILNGVSDIEKLLLEDLDESEVFGEIYLPKLPESSKLIKQSLQCFKVVSEGDQADREPLGLSEFNPDDCTHSCVLDYSILSAKLEFNKFKEELSVAVNLLQERYLIELNNEVENVPTSFQSMQIIKDSLDDLQQTESYLKTLAKGLNKVQSTTLNIYRDSYKKAIKLITEKYEAFYPQLFQTSNPTVNVREERYFKSIEAYQRFLKFERVLQQREYLSEERRWMKNKIDLVKFYLYCNSLDMFSRWATVDSNTNAIRFLEDIYDCDLGTMRKPSKHKSSNYLNFRGQYFFLD